MFLSTAEHVFAKKRGIKARVKRWWRLYRVGAQYDVDQFCQILRDQFGDVALRGMPIDTQECSVRVAIPTTTFDSKLYLYRSYGDCLYKGKCSQYTAQDRKDPFLWQA